MLGERETAMGILGKTTERGSFLSTLLLLWIFVSPLAEIIYIAFAATTTSPFAALSEAFFPVRGLLYVANFICVIGIWEYKKWGVYGVAGLALVAILSNIIILGLPPADPAGMFVWLLGIVMLVVVWLAFILVLVYGVRPIWKQMEW